MRRYRRIHRRSARLGTLLLLLVFLGVFMVSCVAGSDTLWMQSVLGLDLGTYAKETVISAPETEDARVLQMMGTLGMLVGNGTRLETFRNCSQLLELYRDRILNAMLRENYGRYVGDQTAKAAVAASDPYLNACVLVPASDFEGTVSRCFGGSEIKNKSGECFSYLRAGYYSMPIEPWESTVEVMPLSCEETAHAYRLTFVLCDGDDASAPYTAYFVKRSDGSFYLRGLLGGE